MVTTSHGSPDPDEDQTRDDRWMRLLVAGHERGAVRRIALWAVLMGSFALVAATAAGANPVAVVVAFIATALLFGTDQLT